MNSKKPAFRRRTDRNYDKLEKLLSNMVDVIETIGNSTADLISSGDAVDAIGEQPGSTMIANSLRADVCKLRK